MNCFANGLTFNLKYKKKKINNKIKDKEFSLNCQIFKDFTNDIFKNLVDKYNFICKKNWKVHMKNESRLILSCPNQIFFDLIKEHAKKISSKIAKIYQNIEEVENILYIGGYCTNEILLDFIKKEFRLLKHLKPSHPDIVVVKGAVLYDIAPNIINSRKAKYSIGFCTRSLYNEEIHGKLGGKKVLDEEGNYRCENCFALFIKVWQTISIDDVITHKFAMVGPRYASLKFYKWYKQTPILYTEEGVELIGKNLLDLKAEYPKGKRGFTIEMKFGGTFIEAKCVHTKTLKEVNVHLYFE